MRASTLLSVITVLGLTLGGCTALPDRETVATTSNEWLTRSGEVISAQGQRLAGLFGDDDAEQVVMAGELREERQALFEQPYIDPLTRYLEEHAEDPRYAEVLTDISRERDRRCAAIADEFAERPANRETLARYRRGYLYSCPAEVNAFYTRVRQRRRGVPPPHPRPMRVMRRPNPWRSATSESRKRWIGARPTTATCCSPFATWARPARPVWRPPNRMTPVPSDTWATWPSWLASARRRCAGTGVP